MRHQIKGRFIQKSNSTRWRITMSQEAGGLPWVSGSGWITMGVRKRVDYHGGQEADGLPWGQEAGVRVFTIPGLIYFPF